MSLPPKQRDVPPAQIESLTKLGIAIQSSVALAPYTTMKVGGPAQFFTTVNTIEQMIEVVRWTRSVEMPYFVLGGGSNMLISDAGIHGLVIHNRCRQVTVDSQNATLVAESGALMAGVARQSVREGLTGLEWAVSVPGTVGGAVVGNAGAHGGEVKDSLEVATLLDAAGNVVEYQLQDFAYAYRASRLKQHVALRAGFNPVVLSARFQLADGNGDEIRARAEQFLQHRRRTQPVEPSLGSTFVNPSGDHAGRLIEQAGLKGVRGGGVEVSALHANFIINPGGVGKATAQDVVRLMRLIQSAVWERFSIHLTPEVQFVGEWAKDELPPNELPDKSGHLNSD